MTDALARLGRFSLDWLRALGHSAFFFVDLLRFSPAALRRFHLVLAQVHAIGNRSLVIIAASGLAVGFVLALQMYYALVTYGAAESLGLIVNLALVRELGPVVTALLFAGRAGTSLTAEIGLMKATDQLAAMEMIGVDPLRRVARPRLWAGIISMPILAQVFNTVAILGAVGVGVSWLGVDAGSFWSNMQGSVELGEDVINGVIKAFAFGVVVTWIAVFEGFDAEPTPEGISTATTRTVVYSSLAVLAMDFLLTAIMFGVD